ncbi:MAG: RNA polymerase sigma factor [Lysobacteraceae bacterium]
MTEPATCHPLHPLLCAARQGDAEALNRLLARSRSQVIRYAERHCAVNDVEDAVQETLILTARYLNALRVLEAFNGWLFRIVKRECDRLKRAVRMNVYDYAPDLPMPEPVLQSANELRRDLTTALQSLPPHYLEVLLMRDAEELTIEEMAERLGLQRAAVKSRLHRARAMVREYLKP